MLLILQLREAERQRDLAKTAGMTGAIGRGTFGGARQALLQAEQGGLGKDVGLAGLASTLEASKSLGALGATEQQANLERLKAQAATAEEKQAYDQQLKDLEYQKFQEGQNYQRSLLEYYSNILRGNAGALGSSQVQYTPAPSIASQVGGLGLAGLGLYNLLGKG
jgi:hypothetical protein